MKIKTALLLAVNLALFQSAQAQQVTIDFSEFTQNEASPVTSRGYEISGWGSWHPAAGDNYIGVSGAGTSNAYFYSEGYNYSCAGLCSAEASIAVEREDGGPFAVYGLDTSHIYGSGNLFRGVLSTGGWVDSSTPLGTGGWLSVTSINGSISVPEYGYGEIYASLTIDNIVVEEILNIEVDLNPNGNNEIRPNDAYFFTIGVQSLSIADGDARDFDATTIDPAQVTAGPNRAPNVANPITTDYDGDGDLDRVFGFRMEDTGITCLDPNDDIKLVATTTGGETVAGKDVTVRVGCGDLMTLNFEELTPGTSPVLSKGYSVTGDTNVVDIGGDIVIETTDVCSGQNGGNGCWQWHATHTLQKQDGSPFALYSFDWSGFLGNCFGPVCGLTGTTTWGETIRTGGSRGVPLGTGGWLSLQSVDFEGDHFDTEGFYCDFCQFWTDDWVVSDAVAVEMDFDPWSAANEIRPNDDYLITVQLTNTNVADGDAFDFDPTIVDPASLRLGPGEAQVAAAPLTLDLDGDGDMDKVFGFQMQDAAHPCNQSILRLSGATLTGVVFSTADTVAPIECEEPMPIDVEPYNPNNRVYPDDAYQVQIAIMATSVADGDAYDFNPFSVSSNELFFGPALATPVNSGVSTDVDGDGDNDRIFTFEMQDSGIACGDTEVDLVSERDGWPGDLDIPLIGTDSIQTEDCTEGCHP